MNWKKILWNQIASSFTGAATGALSSGQNPNFRNTVLPALAAMALNLAGLFQQPPHPPDRPLMR